ncbi:MAG: hypothetical protein M0Z52_07205 [Actinomycetota bacterium]|nr:hypothetical protein [Actinomycetota bacterium]
MRAIQTSSRNSSKIIQLFAALSVTAILAACGAGGGGGSSSGGPGGGGGSTTQLTITVGNNWQTAQVETGSGTFLAKAFGLVKDAVTPDEAAAAIPSNVASIGFIITAADMATISTNAPVSGQTSITETFNVPNGNFRAVRVNAMDGNGDVLYTGNITLNLNGGAVSQDVAMTNALCYTPVSSNQMPVCFVNATQDDSLYINTPYVTVYITNASGVSMPFNLLLDTGATGVLINQDALQAAGVNIARNNGSFCGQFGDSSMFGGYVSNATVATLASGGLSTNSSYPVAVNQDTAPNNSNYSCPGFTPGNAGFPSGGFLQGDFGMGLSPSYTFGYPYTTPSLPAYLPGYTDGFFLSFTPITTSNGSSYTGSGTITYGLSGGTTGYSFFPNDARQSQAFPSIDAEFGGVINDPSYTPTNNNYLGQNYFALFDTGSTFMFMGGNAMSNAVSGMPTIDYLSNYEYNQGLFGTGTALVNGGLFMTMGLYNGAAMGISNLASYDQGASFTTSPNTGNYQFSGSLFGTPPNNGYILFKDTILDWDPMYGVEDMGMSYFFNHSMYWASDTSANGWGVGMQLP